MSAMQWFLMLGGLAGVFLSGFLVAVWLFVRFCGTLRIGVEPKRVGGSPEGRDP